ncbi:hypothetical protein [Limnohabitans sp. Jir72]|uniref:hypothetical protein n=1 Tax=Limnohabitans sp. Jir72 TaxID=1977909 RepID=UPI000D3CFBC5|nr:hypothetical protein [Limnohabitans sp. Jir72]PUE35732.1 hypothetical protein B9Z52_00670 [Limnohabitans sp. Jir72]
MKKQCPEGFRWGKLFVIPAQAGIQGIGDIAVCADMDLRVRGDDIQWMAAISGGEARIIGA